MQKVIIIMLFVLLLGFAVIGCESRRFNFNISKDFSIDNVKEINIDNESWELNLKKSSDDKIHVIAECSNKDIEKEIDIDINDKVLKINQHNKDKGFMDNFTFNKEGIICIYFPDLKESKVVMNNSSGNLYIDDVVFENININNKSGSDKISKLRANNIDLNSESGDINLENCQIQNVKLNSRSGDIYLNNLISEKNNVYTELGEVSLKEAKEEGNTNIQTNSGNVTVIYNDKPKLLEVSAYSNSNDVEIDLDDFVFGKKEANGKEGKIGDGINTLNVKSNSGEIDIKNYR